MSQSKSKLLNYISLLLSDDEALQRFLVDPITDAEGKYGLTKAERAVLRRTVFHLSNRSLNGYTLVRHLGSYRRSLRLLQNVLHNVGSKMAQEAHVAATAPVQAEAAASATQNSTYTVVYYYPNTGGTTVDFTGQNNDQVQANYGGAYSQSRSYTVILADTGTNTIQNVMNAAQQQSDPTIPGTDSSGDYVINLTLPIVGSSPADTFTITGNPTDQRYNLKTNPDADFVFWFWSINGTPRPSYVGDFGNNQLSFTSQNATLQNGDTLYWQLIAPDSTYGFQPCTAAQGNAFAEAAKAAKASKT